MVRVYGLERSGTNLLEWAVVNHFKRDYKRIEVIGSDPNMRYYNEVQSLKHTTPTKKYADKNLVIYKEFKDWEKSWEGKYKKKGEWKLGGETGCTRSVYDNYLKQAKKIGALLIKYDDFVNDYENQMQRISEYLGIEIKILKSLPTKKMGTNIKPCEL